MSGGLGKATTRRFGGPAAAVAVAGGGSHDLTCEPPLANPGSEPMR
jgi:hypothetical protein